MKRLYDDYIEEMKPMWSPASVKSERMRLNKLLDLVDGDAPKLWGSLKEYGSYTRATLWTRVAAFWDWGIENRNFSAPNPYKLFKAKNKQVYKVSTQYVKRPCKKTFEEAEAFIKSLPSEHEDCKNKLLQLLYGALRRSESYTLTPDGYVTGKGNKVRKVYVPDMNGPMAGQEKYSKLLRFSKPFGITPHKLRSIRLTDVAEKGATMAELTEIAGWAGPGPALSYLAARDERKSELMKLEKK